MYDVNKALADIQEISKQLTGDKFLTADHKEVLQKQYDALNEKLDLHQKKSDELCAVVKQQEKIIKESEEKINTLEKEISRYGTGNPEYKGKSKAIEDLLTYTHCLKNRKEVPERILKSYFRTDINPDGGFLLGPEFYNTNILEPKIPTSNVRAYASVMATESLRNNFVNLTDFVQVQLVGEGEEVQDSASKYSDTKLFLNAQIVRAPVTKWMLQYSYYNLETHINNQVARKMRQNEGKQFVKGTGVKEAIGFLNPQAKVPVLETENTGDITVKDLINLSLALENEYNPIIAMNRFTMQHVRSLATSTGQLQFYQGDLRFGQVNSINGVPVVIFPDMPGTSAPAGGTTPIICADFASMYQILDGMNMAVDVDPYSDLKKNIVNYQFTRWIGGGVVMPEAGVILKVKA